jgi:hypothetical protein
MAYWWDGDAAERYWVEIRQVSGIGTYLTCPDTDDAGKPNPWYELVASVHPGDVVYHWNVRESRFIGRSSVAAAPEHLEAQGEYFVELEGFSPLVADVSRQDLLARVDGIYALRDKLEAAFPGSLYLPFQFTKDRSKFRFISNYFGKLPAVLVEELFGPDGMAWTRVDDVPDDAETADAQEDRSPDPGTPRRGFLQPFQSKADSDYMVQIVGGRRRRSRRHEKLVNDCATWLKANDREPARNAAIDLGLQDEPVIIEAKMVGKSWPSAIRQAVGQLYEYRYFKVSDPKAHLVFLADQAVPDAWVTYLERDRNVGVMWPTSSGYRLSRLASRALRL